MNLAQQRRTILVCAMLTFALGALSHAQKGELPTARFLIGTGGIFTLISVFADMGLPIGAAMAIVVTLTATLTEGEGVINLLAGRSGSVTEGMTKAEKAAFKKSAKKLPGKVVEPGDKINTIPGTAIRTTPIKPLGVRPKQVGF